jgi:hypothetical protein
MVLGFIFFWPVGLALLAYMIWGKQMFARSCGHRRHHDHHHGLGPPRDAPGQPTGNRAFDATRPKHCAGWKKNRRRSRPSCSACAVPRTSPSSTPSWTTAPAPRRPGCRSGRPPPRRNPKPARGPANTDARRSPARPRPTAGGAFHFAPIAVPLGGSRSALLGFAAIDSETRSRCATRFPCAPVLCDGAAALPLS